MTMLKPVCVPCRRFFRCEKVGYHFTEGMPNGTWPWGGPTQPGSPENDRYWQPYKLWVGDLWRCHGCGAEIIVGVAGSPVAHRHEKEFAEKRRNGFDQLQVNDC